MLEVISPGLLDTVQDLGFTQGADLGVPRAGACDAWSLAVACRLLGDPPEVAALEMTGSGPTLAVRRTCVVALAGADLGAHVPEEGRLLPPGTAQLVHAGTRIAFDGGRGPEGGTPSGGHGVSGARPTAGWRTYLGLAGGIDVPKALGSRSTCLAGAFGGLEGRALRAGDLLRPGRPDDLGAPGRRWPTGGPDPVRARPLRLLPSPATLGGPAAGAFEALLAGTWRVGAVDRLGLRLDGPPLPADREAAGRLVSRGVIPGAVQVLPDGTPVVLLADAQTVGGYPVAGVVIGADLPWLGQLGPGDRVRFRAVNPASARAARTALERRFALLAARLERGPAWDLLADAAG